LRGTNIKSASQILRSNTPRSCTYLRINNGGIEEMSEALKYAYLSSSVRGPWLSLGAVVVIVAVSKVELFGMSSLSKNPRAGLCGSPDQPSLTNLGMISTRTPPLFVGRKKRRSALFIVQVVTPIPTWRRLIQYHSLRITSFSLMTNLKITT
jgi:hypothetical protein